MGNGFMRDIASWLVGQQSGRDVTLRWSTTSSALV
jgi:hypothetical protein